MHYRWPDLPGPQIEHRLEAKKNAVLAFAAANPIDRRIYDIPDATFMRHAQSVEGYRANTAGYNLGQSFVYLAHPRFNVVLETVMNQFQSVTGPGTTEWSRVFYVSPGIRWAYNFKNGLQIVPGLAMPIGVGPSAGEKGVFAYLSFEHPFLKESK